MKVPPSETNRIRPSLPNTVIKGRYQILSPFRETDKAFLFKGKHLENGLPIVVKIIKDRFVANPDFIENYSKELDTASKLESCEQVVKMYDYNYITQRFCVISEYVHSWSLDQILSKKYVLPLHGALRVIREIALVTGAAYKNGINSRHLKLDNGLVDIHTGAFKITHFSLTGASKLKGGMANKQFSMSSDILTFGILLYRIFCFSYPFENRSEIPEVVADSLTENLRRNYKEIGPEEIKAIRDIFVSSTTRDVSRRYTNYDTFIKDISASIARCAIPKMEAHKKKMAEKESLLSTAFDTVAALRGDIHSKDGKTILSEKELASLNQASPDQSSYGFLVWGSKPESMISLDSPIVTFILIGLTGGLLLGLVFKLFF